jgi:hypothetical protein
MFLRIKARKKPKIYGFLFFQKSEPHTDFPRHTSQKEGDFPQNGLSALIQHLFHSPYSLILAYNQRNADPIVCLAKNQSIRNLKQKYQRTSAKGLRSSADEIEP